MKATLFIPGKEPFVFLDDNAAYFLLDGKQGVNRNLDCRESRVADALVSGTKHADCLYVDSTCAIWGLNNAADYDDAVHNPEAEEAALKVCGEWCDFSGPILIVEAE